MMNLIKFLRGIIRTHDDQYVSHGDDPRAIILDEMVALEDGEDFMKLSPRESDRVMKLTKKQESESHVKGEFTVTLRETVDALDELGKYGFRKSFTGKTEQEFLDYLRESPEVGGPDDLSNLFCFLAEQEELDEYNVDSIEFTIEG